MNRYLSDVALEDYEYFRKNHKQFVKKTEDLLNDIEKHPYSGLGKPEALRNDYSGYWSRRINKEHRLIYKVDDDNIYIAAFRYHYHK